MASFLRDISSDQTTDISLKKTPKIFSALQKIQAISNYVK